MPYAIQNQRTKKFVTGTDYRYHPAHQRTKETIGLMFEDEEIAMYEFRHRQCGKDYQIVEIEPISIKKINPIQYFSMICTEIANQLDKSLSTIKKGLESNDQT